MKDCCDNIILISCLVDGQIDPSDKLKLEEHLAVCPECRELYEYMKDTSSVLGSLSKTPPQNFTSDIMDKISTMAVKPKKKQIRKYIIRYAAVAAVIALAVFSITKFPSLTATKTNNSANYTSSSTSSESENSLAYDSVSSYFSGGSGGSDISGNVDGSYGIKHDVANDMLGSIQEPDFENPDVREENKTDSSESISNDSPPLSATGNSSANEDFISSFNGRGFCLNIFAKGDITLPEDAELIFSEDEQKGYCISISDAEQLIQQGYEFYSISSTSDEVLLIVYDN